MVGALGVVGNAVGRDRERRESRNSTIDEQILKRRPTIGEILASRHVLSVDGGGFHDRVGGVDGLHPMCPNLSRPETQLPPEKLSLKEQIKFYVSLALGILATLCVFALLFLIPLVIEPSISTILADFDPEPATCVTTDSNLVTGLTKCTTFSSCREGCTSPPSSCYQIYVSYRKPNTLPIITNFTVLRQYEWMDESKWDESYIQLFINVKGCGYPPKVKCEDFGQKYGREGQTFKCFYSRSNPTLVVTDYNWEETAYPLIIALVPTILFAISIAILSSWYCPSCEERGKLKRPQRHRYSITRSRPIDITNDYNEKTRKSSNINNARGNELNTRNNRPTGTLNSKNGEGINTNDESKKEDGQVVVNQPLRRKYSIYHPNSSSLATISSGDTTVSSINSEDGWQSPPSPPLGNRFNTRMNTSSKSNISTKTRKL